MRIRELLTGVPVFARPLPEFFPAGAPDRPDDLFASWLAEALAARVVEPHAMTLSTVDADGLPDTRVVLLKDVDDRGWLFTGDAGSAKGRHLAGRPVAALGFYWREQGRQVRVRGGVTPLDRRIAADDFLARPAGSRVASLAGRQSTVLADPADLDHALAAARAGLTANPAMVPETHTVYAVTATDVEFWQGHAGRRHVRLRYRRAGTAWVRELLWP